MTEEQKDHPASEEGAAQEEVAPVEVEEVTSAEPAEGRRKGWAVAVAVIAAILALCTVVVCVAAAIAALSGGGDKVSISTAVPAPTAVPVPTRAPGQAMIAITEPDQGQVVDISQSVKVQGKGVGLTEGNVVVEALDWQGTVLDRRPATLQGPDVGTGGEGTWSTELTIKVEPGTAGRIRAYHPSALDGSIVAEDMVEVSLGRTAAVQSYIRIDEPTQGALLDIIRAVGVRGSGAGLPEGNVVVEALDAQGNVLAQVPTTLQGPDVGTGGEGGWSTELTIEVEPGTAGRIRAFSPSPLDGSIIAEDSVEVSLGQTPAVEVYLKIDSPAQGTTLEVSKPVEVRGTGAGLPEGNIVVVAVDQDGEVLAEQPTTLQGPDVGAGGPGTWSAELAVPASGQVPGYIAAFSASPKQRDLIASDHVQVTFSGAYTLEGTTWLLDKTIPGSEITALFANGQVSGSAGCNNYQGEYRSTRAVGRNTIEIGPLATTRMMCDEPLMDQEGIYLAALEAATEYTIEGFALTITYPGGEMLFYDKDGPRPRR
ncbi:MAG TPA: Gmad2 immunoglobulin-like domain-containing protein [Anaerolineae bacterium]|nr:Gmad2 immunoglobulin-like domain-containing protein [Anaerolineae bacterium]